VKIFDRSSQRRARTQAIALVVACQILAYVGCKVDLSYREAVAIPGSTPEERMALAKRVFDVADKNGFFDRARSQFPELSAAMANPRVMGIHPHQVMHADTGRVEVFLVCFFRISAPNDLGTRVTKWCKQEVEAALRDLQAGT
jgi:hypothetical protein